MSLVLKVKNSASYIAEQAENVSLNDEAIQDIANALTDAFHQQNLSPVSWSQHSLHPQPPLTNDIADWIFVLDSLNFSFWNDDLTPFTINYKGEHHKGYWALCAALQRATDENIPLFDAEFYSSIDEITLSHILRPSDPSVSIPMLRERTQILRENGKILLDKFNGSFLNVIRQAEGSAAKLVDLIVSNFPSFSDLSSYGGAKVYFLKRAQILVADLWACFEGREPFSFTDIDQLTMFADYRVPQILASLGILEYSQELQHLLKKGELIPHGSSLEIEIRGCSIHAVEKIKQLLPGEVEVNAVLIDFYLWDLAKESCYLDENEKLTHRTRTTFY
ncbi:hypothetical protein GEMRC1_004665 [Eukaryota sp. GEM-RC1]